jgi:hypothetical protein
MGRWFSSYLIAPVALLALGLGAPQVAAAASHRTGVAQPRIAVASPQQNIYPARKRLLVKYSCASAAGIANCTASLAGPGMRARPVDSGTRVTPATDGSYALRITARDVRGRSTTSTVRFLVERTVSWSGYTWFVRHPGWGTPGPNHWSDSGANVRVSGTDLVLSVAKDKSGRWTSAEVDSQRPLGYGTYRWVVASDLSAFDPSQVLGMFTYGGASNDEIDMEDSQWGNPLWANGSSVVWQDIRTHTRQFIPFFYSSHPPYVQQFTWAPGKVSFLITDATGAVLLDWTVTTGVPVPAGQMPIINFWRFHNASPGATTTVRISSFSWTPLSG